MILVFAVPPEALGSLRFDVTRFASDAATSTEGYHAHLHIPDNTERVVAALTLGEVAKPYRNSLLICQDHSDDGEIEETVRFLIDELELRARVRRFLWVRTADRDQMAIVRAFMPGNPMVDPRGVWERLS